MAKNSNGNKYDIPYLVDPVTQAKNWISPSDLIIYVGTVVTDEKGNKKVGVATGKKLGVFLSEKDNEIDSLRKEITALSTSYRKNMKGLLTIIEMLIAQMSINNAELTDLVTKMEEEK